jgi:2-oxoglutarate dehydrogenase complex dehydrogenase (E1) component-like enzyme
MYDKNDTVYIKCIHKTYTFVTDIWVETDPDASYPKITILDPAGTVKVAAAIMSKKAVGKFEYLYTVELTSLAGWWTGYIDVANGAYPDRQPFGFDVK